MDVGKEAQCYHSHHYSPILCGNSSGPAHGFAASQYQRTSPGPHRRPTDMRIFVAIQLFRVLGFHLCALSLSLSVRTVIVFYSSLVYVVHLLHLASPPHNQRPNRPNDNCDERAWAANNPSNVLGLCLLFGPLLVKSLASVSHILQQGAGFTSGPRSNYYQNWERASEPSPPQTEITAPLCPGNLFLRSLP